MSENRLFFHVEFSHIPMNVPLLPFHIYLYNQISHQYTQIHKNGGIFTQEQYEDLKEISQKGGIIAISMNHKKSFLKTTNLVEEDIPDLRPQEKHELLIEHEILTQSITTPFHAKERFLSTLESLDFYTLINDVKDQVLLFDVRIGHTTSLCRDIAKKVLLNDTPNNRIVALCYCMAKLCNINQVKDLSELILASMLHHIGLSTIDFTYFMEIPSKIHRSNHSLYFKHPAMSVQIIRRSGANISQRSLQIILEHHERSDGSGHPNGLKEDKIDPLSFILGACSHWVEYSLSSKMSLKRIIEYQKKGDFISGLENKFGDIIKNGMDVLF